MADTLAPTAENLRCSHWLKHARGMADLPDGATRQREIFERTGYLSDVARFLAGETVGAQSDAEVGV